MNKKEYMKEYHQRPEVKQKHKEYMKEYRQRPEVKQKYKEYLKKRPLPLQSLVDAFYEHFLRVSPNEKALLKNSELFAKTACELTKRQECLLQEKILLDKRAEKIIEGV